MPFFGELIDVLEPLLGRFAPFALTLIILMVFAGVIGWLTAWLGQNRLSEWAYMGEQDERSNSHLVVERTPAWDRWDIRSWSVRSLGFSPKGLVISYRNQTNEIRWDEISCWYRSDSGNWILWGDEQRLKLSLSETSGFSKENRERVNQRLIHRLFDTPRTDWPWLPRLFSAKELNLSRHVPEGLRRFELRSNDPPSHGSNSHPGDLIFYGATIFEAERVWNNEETRGTSLDGEILDRIAIYQELGRDNMQSDQIYAEISRYNPRVIVSGTTQIPFFSYVKGFPSVNRAAEYIHSGSISVPSELLRKLDMYLRKTNKA